MKVLIIKTSSLGDVIHTLPAITDAVNVIPNIHFDWVVEESFAEVPKWHPRVDRVIPVAIRRWRKTFFKSLFSSEVREFRRQLRATQYDHVIDAQGLIKSAVLTYMSRGHRIGLDSQSLTEPLARFAYQKKVHVHLQEHAVLRMRTIFAQALDYELPIEAAEYGITREQFTDKKNQSRDYLMFLHGTTWPTKNWPEEYWLQLACLVQEAGYIVRMPWGNDVERKRVENIAKECSAVEIIPRSNLTEIAKEIAGARAAVAVDTGLGHLSAALGVPTVSLYGPTNPKRIGTIGKHQLHLLPHFDCLACDKELCTYHKGLVHSRKTERSEKQAACFEHLTPEDVWSHLELTNGVRSEKLAYFLR